MKNVLAIFLSAVTGMAALAQDGVTVGYRAKAEPFVYIDEANGELAGFLYEICDAMLKKSGVPHEWVKVESGTRLKELGPKGRIDMLCDPLTITRARAKSILFSPVVFVSGGSYLAVEFTPTSDNEIPPPPYGQYASYAAYQLGREQALQTASLRAFDGTLLERAGPDELKFLNDDAITGRRENFVRRCADLEDGQVGDIRIGVIKDSTGPEIIANALRVEKSPVIKPYSWETVCYVEFDTHDIGIERLCEGTPDEDGYPMTFYFGDRDIIATYLQRYLDKPDANCAHVTLADRFFSIEPYAFGFSERLRREEHIKLQHALLETFSEEVRNEDGTSEPPLPFQLFRKYFPNKRASDNLNAVFKSLIVPEK